MRLHVRDKYRFREQGCGFLFGLRRLQDDSVITLSLCLALVTPAWSYLPKKNYPDPSDAALRRASPAADMSVDANASDIHHQA